MRMHGVGRLRGRIGGAGAAALDLGEAGARQDVGVAFAPAFVVAAEQAAFLRDHAGIAGAVERRAPVADGQVRQPGDRIARRRCGSPCPRWRCGPSRRRCRHRAGRSCRHRNSTWSMSSPSPSAAICASAVQAPCPMSWAPVSTSPLPSVRLMTARALAWNIRAGNVAVPRPQPTRKPELVAHLARRRAAGPPSRNARRPARSIRAGPSRRTACRRSARLRRSS